MTQKSGRSPSRLESGSPQLLWNHEPVFASYALRHFELQRICFSLQTLSSLLASTFHPQRKLQTQSSPSVSLSFLRPLLTCRVFGISCRTSPVPEGNAHFKHDQNFKYWCRCSFRLLLTLSFLQFFLLLDLWGHRKGIALVRSPHVEKLHPPNIYEGQPIRRKILCGDRNENSLFQIENELTGCIKAQNDIKRDYFKLWLMQSCSNRVQEKNMELK